MSITFTCPDCKQSVQADDESAGHRMRCPHCERNVDVPWGNGPAEENPFAVVQEQAAAEGPTARQRFQAEARAAEAQAAAEAPKNRGVGALLLLLAVAMFAAGATTSVLMLVGPEIATTLCVGGLTLGLTGLGMLITGHRS